MVGTQVNTKVQEFWERAALAAVAGLCADPTFEDDVVEIAATLADRLTAIWQKRFCVRE